MNPIASIRRTLGRLRVRHALKGEFNFIHINKCGGTSVEKALHLPKMHHTARKRRDIIGKERWEKTPSFALVRCPYAKVASHYRYRVKLNNRGLASEELSVNEWIKEAYGEKNPRYYDKPIMFAPCVEWVTDESGEIMVDLVLRLEEVNQNWHQVEELIGRSAVLPRANTTSRALASTEDGLNAQSIEIINDHFQADFDAFGYTRRKAS